MPAFDYILPGALILQLPVAVLSVRNGPGAVLRREVRLPVGETLFDGVSGEVLRQGLERPILGGIRQVDLHSFATVCERIPCSALFHFNRAGD